MRAEVHHYVRFFSESQVFGSNPKLQMHHIKPVLDLFDTFSIEVAVLLPLTERDNRFMIISVDDLTRWVTVRPSPFQTADSAVSFLRRTWRFILVVWMWSGRTLAHKLHQILGIQPSERLRQVQRWLLLTPENLMAEMMAQTLKRAIFRKVK